MLGAGTFSCNFSQRQEGLWLDKLNLLLSLLPEAGSATVLLLGKRIICSKQWHGNIASFNVLAS